MEHAPIMNYEQSGQSYAPQPFAKYLTLLLLAVGCSPPAPRPSEPIRPVKTMTVFAGDETHQRAFSGRVEASKKVELAFQVPGLLATFPVKLGQKVAKGELIGQVRQDEFQARLKALQGQLDQARAGLRTLLAGDRPEQRLRLEAQVRAAEARMANARAEYERNARLVQSGAVGREEAERTATAYRVAQEDYQAAKQLLEKGTIAREEDIDGAEAQVRGLEARVIEANLQLTDSTLRAPYDGLIAQRFVEQNQIVTARQPIVKFQDVDEIDIVVAVPETVMANIRTAEIVESLAEFSGAPGLQFPVHIKEVAQALQSSFEGRPVGFYREPGSAATGAFPQESRLLPIIARPPLTERNDIGAINSLQIWSPAAGRMIPMSQVVSGAEVVWEDPVIMRRNRFPTLTVYADPRTGLPSELFQRVRPKLEAMELPPGYSLEWGGEFEDSTRARASLARPLPYVLALMVFICVCLFNSIRVTLLMWLFMPLAIIGVTTGLLLTNMPFTFMALLGILSLGGELIKMQIVVLSKSRLEIEAGKSPYQAIIDGSTAKMRPVCMVVITTVLGMIPLLVDPFFGSMAVALMFGLAFAVLLCLIVTPVAYAIFFRIHEPVAAASSR